MVTVVKCNVNMGALPYFDGENAHRLRMVSFHQDRMTEKFPRLHSLTRIEDVLEMNLFLEHRYKGMFMSPKRGGHANSLGGVSLLTLNSIAYSLSIFLDWLE